MALIVQKYGGTSVATTDHIQAVADKVIVAKKQGHQVVVVVSAMSGETDRLLQLAKNLAVMPKSRELDVLLSTGEQVTIALLSIALMEKGYAAVSYTGSQVSILTDNKHNKARILDINAANINAELKQDRVIVIAGFQGVDEHGNITTLGRGGSDTTAVAIAAALKADECQIYTDVDGVYTADPNVVNTARRLKVLTYEEMLEMASLGSKVLQIRSVELAGKYDIKLRVLSSFKDGAGTLISDERENDEGDNMEQAYISGIAHSQDEAKLTVIGVPDMPGIASQILTPIAVANIEIDMIVQNVGIDNTTDFTFTVHRNDYQQALSILKETADEIGAKGVSGDDTIVKISVVGIGMRSHAGIASKMFTALASEGINIKMISTSEIKVSVAVAEKYLELAVRTLHTVFELEKKSVSGDNITSC